VWVCTQNIPPPHWDSIPGPQEVDIKMNQTLNPGKIANAEISSIRQYALYPNKVSGFL
jgi:hypothetical protein